MLVARTDRYSNSHLTERAITILKKASFLDPRFKTKYLTEVDICDDETEPYCECCDALSVAAPQSPHETTDPPPLKSLGAFKLIYLPMMSHL